MVVRIVFTCSIINPERNEIYKNAITDTMNKLKEYPVLFYIVENNGVRKTSLDDISGCNLLYTATNNIAAYESRKGIKEFFDIMFLADYYNFDNNDIIIKLTGRYTLKSPSFIDIVLANINNFDCFIKSYNICTKEFDRNDCVLGLYGLRYSVFKNINPLTMLYHHSMEVAFMKEVREEIDDTRILQLYNLDMYFQGDINHLV